MRRSMLSRTWLASVALLTAACVTINVYFPEAAVRDLSQKIEDEVAKEAAKQEEAGTDATPETAPEGDRQSRTAPGLLDLVLGTTPAYAAGEVPDPGVSNPAIRKIIESRAARAAALETFKSQGAIGENNQALVEIVALDAVADLRKRAEVQRLVKAENADREQLYREIAAAQDVDLSQLPRIRETYADTLRDNARPGHKIQMPDGSWKTK
jgi:uncharacterized protein YdbL (DUF1318 family)